MKIGSYIAVTLLLFSAWIPVTAQAGEPPASATGPTQTLSAVLKDTWQTNPSLLACLLYTSPSPRDGLLSRMPSSA